MAPSILYVDSKQMKLLFDFDDVEVIVVEQPRRLPPPPPPPKPIIVVQDDFEEPVRQEVIVEKEKPLEFIHGDIDNIAKMLPILYPGQHKNVSLAEERFKVGKGVMFTDGTGTGKAQPLDSKIMTINGWKLMRDITTNDFVISSEGTKTKILGIYPQGIKDIYEVIFSDGAKTECCGEHLWETQTLYQRRKTSGNINSIVGKPKIRTLLEIQKTIKEQHFIPIVKPIELNKVYLEIHPYIMGSILGDGNFTHNHLGFSSSDIESVIEIEKLLPNDLMITLKNDLLKEKCPQYYIRHKEIKKTAKGYFATHKWLDELKRLKLHGLKSNHKFIPEIYLNGSIEQRTNILQGLLDTDGTVDTKTKSPSFSSTSIQLANGIAYLVRSLGGTCTIKNKRSFYTYDGERKQGLNSFVVHINLPKEIIPFRLSRKLNIYRPNYKYPPRRKIVSINYIGKKEAQCISIEDKRSLYVTDDCVLTHNTLSGLGVVYRFYHQNKKDILIVVPTDQKCLDWKEEALMLDLYIYQLVGTHDNGSEITVTTYANFYQNDALREKDWDLILYDESHYLGQNASGVETSYFEQHKQIANLPSAVRHRAFQMYEHLKPTYDGSGEYYKKAEEFKQLIQRTVEEITAKTKVVFLSATPFAYHKSTKYGDGTLWDIEEHIIPKEASYQAYNTPTPVGDFLIENFGYRMSNNKVTIPESGVDTNLMERNFFENMKEKGVMSTRILELDQDYSRDFITLDSDIGDFINKGMEEFHTPEFQKTFPLLSSKFGKKYNYNYVNQLLECIKAREIAPRIQQHIDLGRKVVVFHSYNHAAIEHPFHFNPRVLLDKKEEAWTPKLIREINLYKELYPEYHNLDLSGLKNTRDAILEHFPEMKQFNGTISKKLRREFLKDFNNDHGNTDLFLIQQKAGKEGISLHDKTGRFQRVLIQLGLPTEPTTCIQIEGRTYRQGVKSNAPYEYMTLQTTFERIAFGDKIATRSRTAENLAMGNLARNLEQSFKEGYLNSSYKVPSLDQGSGGKETDKFNNEIDEFEKAKTYYFARGKRNAKNKAKEGGDYFATPEPLGYKIVQWLNPQANEHGLEPSAGHGAIARFFPGFTNNHFIEQNINLTGELCINAIGVVKVEQFEKHSFINKYNFIAMNPPFGTSGKLAMEHIHKAIIRHSHPFNFRLITIVPCGPSMDKRIHTFLFSEKGQKYYVRTQIRLPDCTFTRAGTNVSTRILEFRHKGFDPNWETNCIDLSYIQNIGDFFTAIKDLEI